MFSENAIAAMAREDAKAEADAKRNGWMRPNENYGFVLVSRNTETGAIQHSRIFASRTEALSEAMARRWHRDIPWMHEGVERVRTVLSNTQLARRAA